jgi:hypothetical protein
MQNTYSPLFKHCATRLVHLPGVLSVHRSKLTNIGGAVLPARKKKTGVIPHNTGPVP